MFRQETGLRIECIIGSVRQLNKEGSGILFIDEASNATQATQGALLGVINDNTIGETVIHPRVRMILAANPSDSAASGRNLVMPLANRMAHFDVVGSTYEKWNEWYLTEGTPQVTPAEDLEAKVVGGWNRCYAQTKGLLSGFLNANRALLDTRPPKGSPQRGRAWNSRRTWVMAGRAVATAACLGFEKTELPFLLVQGFVGPGPATEWLSFVTHADLPTPEQALDGQWTADPQQLDQVYAVVTSMTAFVAGITDPTEKNRRAVQLWAHLYKLWELHLADMAMVSASALVAQQLGTQSQDPAVVEGALAALKELSRSPAAQYAAKP